MKTFNIFWLTMALAVGIFSCDSSQADKPKKKDKKESKPDAGTGDITVLEKWEMPGILREVSGIEFIDKNRFACVQDESGVVFIYNIKTKEIESEIDFGAAGDYEGIALVNKTA